MAARVQATQETIDKFWADVAEKASEVPLPPSLVSVGFEEMQLPRVVLDNELKKDNEKMVGFVLRCFMVSCRIIFAFPESNLPKTAFNLF